MPNKQAWFIVTSVQVKTPEDLLLHTRQAGSCLVWTLGRDSNGYGTLLDSLAPQGRPRQTRAHRRMYELVHGVLLDRYQFVCHSCDNPSCLNPDHLWVGSAGDNARDMVAKERHRPAGIRPEVRRAVRSEFLQFGRTRRQNNVPELARKYGVSTQAVRNWTGAA